VRNRIRDNRAKGIYAATTSTPQTDGRGKSDPAFLTAGFVSEEH